MRVLLHGGILPDSSRADILVEDGRIKEISTDILPSTDTQLIDISASLVTCALADVHVHFREPGRPDKETIKTGSMAAAHGGYSVVCAMPNLSPAPDSLEHIAIEQSIIDRDAVVDVLPYATITKDRAGLEVVDIEALKDKCVAFSDDGSGVQKDEVMLEAMRRAAAADCIIAAHCEDNSLLHGGYIHDGRYCRVHGHKGISSESEWKQIERDLKLCKKTGCHYHVCHISTKESVELIRKAKAEGVNVSCETAPHYLVLCEDDIQEDGRFKMNPPLRSAEDRAALIEGIKDGTIDLIATDHAPHTAEEKSRGLAGSAMGISGLEAAFPVLYTRLVREGVISLEKLLELMSLNPRRVFRLGGQLAVGSDADIAVFNLSDKFHIDSKTFLSKGKSTPFDGMEVYGRCVLTMLRGKIVWQQ